MLIHTHVYPERSPFISEILVYFDIIILLYFHIFDNFNFFAIFLQYISMYSEMGSKSNTMIFSDRPADVNGKYMLNIYVCIYICLSMYIYIYIYMYVCIYVCKYVYI
jgi:hypothetical protein